MNIFLKAATWKEVN